MLYSPKRKLILYAVIVFVILFGICLLFPYTGDDWAWGSQIGLERLERGFENYNGRYLGNLIILVLSRCYVLRSAVVAATLVGMSLCICGLTDKKNIPMFSLALALIMLMPAKIGAQAIVWASGFTNYAIPTLLLLVYLNICKTELIGETRSCNPSTLSIVGCTILGLSNSLIMENVTLFNVFISAAMLVFIRVRYGKWSKLQLSFLAGSIIGACIMFSNGAYWKIASGEQKYQSASLALVGERASIVMPKWLLGYSWAIPACLAVACLYSTATSLDKAEANKKRCAAKIISLAIIICILSLCIYVSFIQTGSGKHPATSIASAGGICVLIMLAFAFFLSRKHSEHARLIVFIVICLAILMAPLLVVSPVGPRNFFIPYVLECAIACLAWSELVNYESKLSSVLICSILAAVLTSWLIVYWPIHKADVQRNEEIAQAAINGETGITVSPLPDSKHLHCANPTEGIWENRYKLFYGIPEDFDIIVKKG